LLPPRPANSAPLPDGAAAAVNCTQLDRAKQELKEAVEQGCKELLQQIQHTGASWVS
jgi:predicted negative regulator of RcsB-dependent stress response